MLLSNYFLPIIKDNPNEASIVSHRLMLRTGMIRQLTSGIYSWLPLGMNVLTNISNIIKAEMNKIGVLEVLMPALQPAELWQESGRYDDYGKEMLRMQDRHERQMLFGPTHEEVMTDIFRNNIKSYRDLPKRLYQVQWKFRDEVRPRFGVMRAREFLMKDAYSFDQDFESAKVTYNLFYQTYFKIFKALGLNAIAVSADSGAIGGNLSHEFHVIADTGESEIFYDVEFENLIKDNTLDIEKMHSLYAAADEKHDPSKCNIPEDRLKSKRGIEVGHVFYFGTKYSEAMKAYVVNNKGEQTSLEMGSYGIGVSRLVGAIIEANYDDMGIIWPEQIAPFYVSLINLKPQHEKCTQVAEELYQTFLNNNITVLMDDSHNTPGSKLATHDLIGTPWQVIVGPNMVEKGKVELKNRRTMVKEELSIESLLSRLIRS